MYTYINHYNTIIIIHFFASQITWIINLKYFSVKSLSNSFVKSSSKSTNIFRKDFDEYKTAAMCLQVPDMPALQLHWNASIWTSFSTILKQPLISWGLLLIPLVWRHNANISKESMVSEVLPSKIICLAFRISCPSIMHRLCTWAFKYENTFPNVRNISSLIVKHKPQNLRTRMPRNYIC